MHHGGWIMRLRALLFVAILLLGLGSVRNAANAQDVTSSEQSVLAGPWHGRWTAPEGWLYEAVMTLQIGKTGAVDGEIKWTLRTSARRSDDAKVGMTGTEFVRGTYFPASGAFHLDGYRKNDPNSVIGLDKYRLIAGDNRNTIAGVTEHHGNWAGQFVLTRD
jgi:hypothetical protein